jgi:hypothetical protein
MQKSFEEKRERFYKDIEKENIDVIDSLSDEFIDFKIILKDILNL